MMAAANAPLGEMRHYGGRKRSRRSTGLLIGGGVVGLGLIALFLWPTQQISQRPHDMKTTQVFVPPPPPPPPPEPQQVEQPPEPKPVPMEQPIDTPPPPQQSAEPVQGDSALTAREGAGPSNYGLARGDGGGTTIGSRPGGGGDAFRAYASVAQACISRATQGDRELSRGRYRAEIAVTMAADGRIANARVSGVDERRAGRIRELLGGVQCQTPPPGLPLMRLELSTRSGG
jgi:periplasmic protein TonB